MNKLSQITAAVSLCLLASAAALAEDTPRTRAEVIAELNAARASGELGAFTGEDGGSMFLSRQALPSSLTRAEVIVETRLARVSGEIDAYTGEDSGSDYLSHHAQASRLTRADVIAETQQARAHGEMAAYSGEDSGSAFISRQLAVPSTRYAGPDIGRDKAEWAERQTVHG